MKQIAITGRVKITGRDTDSILSEPCSHLKGMRFIHPIEKLSVAGVCLLLSKTGIHFPVGRTDTGIYIGIDNAIEGIKDEFFKNILTDGVEGSSPLLFPFTSPNALAAQLSIVFDIRGESITFAVKSSCLNVIEYAVECLLLNYSRIAISGGILSSGSGKEDLQAEFLLLEDMESAKERGAFIYHQINGMNKHEIIL
jgi:3-oxoacyl-(acyl-carrier-protein) synthase